MRSVRLVAAAALTIAAAITATTAAAAPGDGTLTVTMVDEHGDPMPGGIYAIGEDGPITNEMATATTTFTLPPGAYGVLAFTPWGGLQCAGVDPCEYILIAGGTADPDGDLVVTAGQDTTVTITGTPPAALHGPARVGKPLVVDLSDGMDELVAYLTGVGGGAYSPTFTWLRDGEPIAGAQDDHYTPTGADAGRSVSVRLAYGGLALEQFQQLTGEPITPRTTNVVKIGKVPTKSFAILSNPQIKAGSRGKVRVEVTAKNQVVTGKVTVTVGDWSATRALRNGSTRILLPALGAGKHTVDARFLGSGAYEASKAKSRTLTVS